MSVPDDLYQDAQSLAARRGTTVTALTREFLIGLERERSEPDPDPRSQGAPDSQAGAYAANPISNL